MAREAEGTRAGRRKAKGPGAIVDAILEANSHKGRDGNQHDGFIQEPGGAVYRYNGKFFDQLTPHTLVAIVYRFDPNARAARLREVVDLLKPRVHQADFSFNRVADWEVPCESGVLDVRDLSLRPHAIDDRIDSIIPWAWDPDVPRGLWHETLHDIFGTDLDRHDAFQDFAGYVLLPHAKLKKAMVLLGPKDTAKSMLVEVLKELVGAAATCALPIDDMDDPQRRSVIKHKRLNIMTELSAEAMIADGGFKALVSREDPILIDEKYEKPIMYVPIAKHVIATNTLPRITDRTEATIARLLIVVLTRVFSAAEMDDERLDKLRRPAVMREVFAWAVEGARRLVANRGQFSECAAGAAQLEQLREESNPMVAFGRERIEPWPTGGIPGGALVAAFNKWHGGKRIGIREAGKMARAAGYPWGDVWLVTGPSAGHNTKGIVNHRLLDESLIQATETKPETVPDAEAGQD